MQERREMEEMKKRGGKGEANHQKIFRNLSEEKKEKRKKSQCLEEIDQINKLPKTAGQ